MTLDKFLGKQLECFVFVSKTLFKKTIGLTIILSFICLLFIAVLYIGSGFSSDTRDGEMGLLSYVWYRYSSDGAYKLVDLSKSVVLFVISFFSIALSRKIIRDKEHLNARLDSFFNEMQPRDLKYLLAALAACLVIDYGLHQLGVYLLANISDQFLAQLTYSLLHIPRIFIPLLIFSYAGRLVLRENISVLTLRECLFLLISLWLFNEAAYEFAFYIYDNVFRLILILVPDEKEFFVESILAIPLLVILFWGYAAITTSVLISRNDEST